MFIGLHGQLLVYFRNSEYNATVKSVICVYKHSLKV